MRRRRKRPRTVKPLEEAGFKIGTVVLEYIFEYQETKEDIAAQLGVPDESKNKNKSKKMSL